MGYDYSVPGPIHPLRQPNTKTCWATVGTMLKSWKERRSLTIEEALSAARSPTYLAWFNQKKGLMSEFSGPFADSMGFRVAPQSPQSLSPQDWIDLMVHRGPLGVMTFGPTGAAHARLMIGMWGDEPGVQVRFIDPDIGTEQRVSFTEFMEDFANAPADTAQIWHY